MTYLTRKCKLSTLFNKSLVTKLSGKKSKNLLVKMVSTADTGYFRVAKRNPKTQTEKLSRRMYDPKVRKHVQFKEEKLK